jgi:hypothetical protein
VCAACAVCLCCSYCGPALASSMYALAVLRYRPPGGWCDALLFETQRQMAAFGAQELSNLIWALAVLQLHPGREWLQDFQMQVCSGGEYSVYCRLHMRCSRSVPLQLLFDLIGGCSCSARAATAASCQRQSLCHA